MHIAEQYITDKAKSILDNNPLAAAAYQEIKEAVCSMVGSINHAEKTVMALYH